MNETSAALMHDTQALFIETPESSCIPSRVRTR